MRKIWSVFLCIMLLGVCIPAGWAVESDVSIKLSNLELRGYSLTPEFDAATAEYAVDIPNEAESAEIRAITEDPVAMLMINGSKAVSGTAFTVDSLSVGENTVTVEVSSADGSTAQTYMLTIIRAEEAGEQEPAPSDNVVLAGLEVRAYELNEDFAAGLTAYSVDIPNEAESVEIRAITEDPGALLMINGSKAVSGTAFTVDSLSMGENTVTIEVSSADGSTAQTYMLTIIRAEEAGEQHPAPGDTAVLAGLEVRAYELNEDFAAGLTAYSVDIPNDAESVEIEAITEDPGALLMINGTEAVSGTAVTVDNLCVGDNTVVVEVISADGSTVQTYTLTIKRSEAKLEPDALLPGAVSDQFGLNSLTVTGCKLSPQFALVTTEYSVSVAGDVNSVEISVTTADTGDTLMINGSGAVSGTARTVEVEDTPVEVEVISADKSLSQTYTVTINQAQDAYPDQIILSWTDAPETTQTVSWRATDSINSGKVQYIKECEQTQDFSGAMEKEALCTELYEGFNHFEAELDNLEEDTIYIYRVGTEDGWSDPSTFSTAAADNKFSFLYLGDMHVGDTVYSADVCADLIGQALDDCPDLKFALQGGDLIDKPTDTGHWESFFNMQAGFFDQIPFMPAMGNHEAEDPDIYLKYFALPQNGPEGLEEQYYSFDYGNAHFAVLDSNRMGSEDGLEWLENDLKDSGKKWRFVMFHHPAYEVTAYGNEKCEVIRENWVPVLERNDVDMAFVGHQHMYMRTHPINDGEIQESPADGIVYVLGVSGNKVYKNPDEHDYIARVVAGEDAVSYSIINIDDDILTLTTTGIDGDSLDRFKISKSIAADSRVAISSVKLLDDSYEEISAISSLETCHLQAHVDNYTSQVQTAAVIFQVRSGSSAAALYGGETMGISSLQTEIPVAGADIYVDFNLADISPGTAYVDVYLMDEAGVPIDVPYEFSFKVNS